MASHRKTPRAAKDWSNPPPPEILSAIEKRLESRIDILRCRSVCKNWRASVNPNPNPSLLSPILPFKISNSTFPFNNRPNETLILFVRTVLLVKPLSSSDDTCNWILTVEEVVQGKLRILYPLSNDHVTCLPSNFPKVLNLLDYNVSEIAKSYGFKYASDEKDVSGVHKVILCSGFTAMVLHGDGILIGARLKTGKWGFVRDSLVNSYADVINFKGTICAVDSKGSLHTIDHKTMKVIKSVVVSPMSKDRIRLVEHEAKLLLVSCVTTSSVEYVDLTCYNLDEQQNKWSKTRVQGWLHFYSLDWCFFVRPHDLNISDHLPKRGPERIKYPYYSRTQSSSWDAAKREYLVLSQSFFKSSGASHELLYNSQWFEGANINQFTGFFTSSGEEKDRVKYLRGIIAGALWPPPIWFLPDAYTSSGEENEDLELWDQNISIDSKGKLLLSLTVAPDLGTAKNSAQVLDTTEVDTNMAFDDSYALRIQHVNPCAATSLFERVKIKSNLVPTSQNIWAKHGNILEESKIRNGDLIAKALESLATTVLILQSSSGRSLDDIQAEYLSSMLSDLQQMHFKVDWLVPFIEKALAVHKSKPLVDSLKDFDEAKARAEETKYKLLDELAKLDEVEENLKFVFEKIPSLESVDLNECLGEGIC